jgi:hypothetical protein
MAEDLGGSGAGAGGGNAALAGLEGGAGSGGNSDGNRNGSGNGNGVNSDGNGATAVSLESDGNAAVISGGGNAPVAGGEPEGGLMFKIGNVQASIFGYEVANVSNNIVSIFGQVISDGTVDTADPQALARLNRLMGECLAAMQSSDFLLLADLLEYRLKPMIGGKT